ncbi:MAG: hypothetical protein MJZ17_05750 [Bacteroidales bacterium]|nr:hypothetical protein [Bacteroidales bacterium]
MSGESTLNAPLFYGKRFNDPFVLNSNLYIPNDFYTALDFALYLAIKNPIYTQAARRTVAHFITDIGFVGKTGSEQEQKDLKGFLVDELGLLEACLQGGMEERIYGNGFCRIHFPFNRYLIDRRNGYRLISVDAFNPDEMTYNYKNLTYRVPDPMTAHLPAEQRKFVDLEFMDRAFHDTSGIRLTFIKPQQMMLQMNYISGETEYIYKFDEFFRADIEAGRKIYQVNSTPLDMLEAISKGEDFKFKADTIFHFKNPFISGVSNNGWGIPDILLNYNAIHQMQVLHCINEAVGLDYILPYRLLSPTPQSAQGGADAATSMNLGPWMQAMHQLIKKQRQDPTSIHAVPFPVNYQELGGNGKALAPVDLLKDQTDTVLDSAGFPAELWHSSLTVQQIPTALRLFESTWVHLHRRLNNFVKWVSKNVLDYMEREQQGVKLLLPSIADDLEQKHIYLQMAAGGEISRKTAYKAFNIEEPVEEASRRAKEDMEIEKEKQKAQEEFEREMTLGSANQVVDAMVQAQGGSGGPPPGPPPGGGGPGMPPPQNGGAVTPLDIEQQGAEQAQQMLQIQDTGERRKALMQIKASNPTLYAVVQRKMEDMRQEGASQGRKMAGQPQ